MTLDASKGQNKSMMFYLKSNRYSPERQEALTNLQEKKKDTSDKKKDIKSWAYQVIWTSMWCIGTQIWEKVIAYNI